ncbi:MAG: hypothetical protein Q9226_009336 [Calogaya cf. arnoldii]
MKADRTNTPCPEQSEDPQQVCCDSPEQRKPASGGHSQSPLVREADANKPSDQQILAPELAPTQQNHVLEASANREVASPAAIGIQILNTPGARTPEQPSSPRDTSPQRWFERVFYMVFLGMGKNEVRVTCLDTCADIDVISHQVVKDLGLQTEEYTGGIVRPLGSTYHPEGQVTLSWHVSGFPKTYTTTFVVFNEQYSKDFDILLGRFTIQRIGFYQKDPNVWFSSAEGDVPVSQAIINPVTHKHSLD